MPALGTLVLTDRASTPVAHTLVPSGRPNGVATVVESTGINGGELKFDISRRVNANAVKNKITLRLPVTQTEIINGISAPKVIRVLIADLQFTFPNGSSEQERKDLVGMLMSSLDPSKVLVNDTLIKNQDVW